jgi:hypothetical protein
VEHACATAADVEPAAAQPSDNDADNNPAHNPGQYAGISADEQMDIYFFGCSAAQAALRAALAAGPQPQPQQPQPDAAAPAAPLLPPLPPHPPPPPPPPPPPLVAVAPAPPPPRAPRPPPVPRVRAAGGAGAAAGAAVAQAPRMMPALLALPSDVDPGCGTLLRLAHGVRVAHADVAATVLVQPLLPGWRVLVSLNDDGAVRVTSRSDGRVFKNEPLRTKLAEALREGAFARGCVIDGVLVAYERDGVTRAPATSVASIFANSGKAQALRARLHAFDMRERGAEAAPYEARQARLDALLMACGAAAGDAAPCIVPVPNLAALTAEAGEEAGREAGRACVAAREDGLVLRGARAPFPLRDPAHLNDRCAPQLALAVKPHELAWDAPLRLMAIGAQRSKDGWRFRLGARHRGDGGGDGAYAYAFAGKADVAPQDAALYARLLEHKAEPPAARAWAQLLNERDDHPTTACGTWFTVPFPVLVRADYRMKDGQLRFAIASAADAEEAALPLTAADELQAALTAHARRAFEG